MREHLNKCRRGPVFCGIVLTTASILCLPASASGRLACSRLSADLQKAIAAEFRVNYDTGEPASEDQEESRMAGRVLVERGKEVLPCLVELFRHGPAETGLWRYKRPAPVEGKWAIDLIKVIDPSTAIKLFKDWSGEAAADKLVSARIDAELATLGDADALKRVVGFLKACATVPEAETQCARPTQDQALEAVSLQHYRAALPALKTLQAIQPKKWSWLPVYVAQLSEDSEALKRYASDPQSCTWALLSLGRMGDRAALKTFAIDETYGHRSLAQDILDGKVR